MSAPTPTEQVRALLAARIEARKFIIDGTPVARIPSTPATL